jgi:hypothetical protein
MTIASLLEGIMEKAEKADLHEAVEEVIETEEASDEVSIVEATSKEDEEDEGEEEKSEKPKKKSSIKFDMKEELEQLTKLAEQAELPADQVTQLGALFEAAVIKHVKQLEENYEAAIDEASDAYQAYVAEEMEAQLQGLIESVDGYLGYVAEEWKQDNAVALVQGAKAQLAESLMGGLRTLFVEHNIDVPDESLDIVAEQEEKISSLNEMVEKLVNQNKQLVESIESSNREKIIQEAATGLTESQKEKFVELVEALEFKDSESFGKKVQALKESAFVKTKKTVVESVVTDAPVEMLTEETQTQNIHPDVQQMLAAYGKTFK